MKTLLLVLAALAALSSVIEAGSNIETKPLEATKPKRYQLGSVIESSEENGLLVEQGESLGDMSDMKIMYGHSPMIFRRSLVTIPIPSDFKEGSNYGDLVQNHGCVLVKFLAMEDFANKDKIPKDAVVIVSNELVSAKMTPEVRKNLRENKVVLGFLKRFKPIEDECRNMFVEDQIPFLENLELPSEIELMSVVKSQKPYYGFKLIFSPFKNATIIYREETVKQKALVNMVDFVLFESDDKLDKFCKENKKKVIDFSEKLAGMDENKYPILAKIERPRFIDRELGSNETRVKHLLQFSGLTGTSIVAPRGFKKDANDINGMSSDFFFSPCLVIEIPAGDMSNFKITKGHLEQWEKDKNIRIPVHSSVLLNTGWWSKWGNEPEKYVKDYPGIEADALKWLVEQRSVASIGIDSLTLDDYSVSKDNKFPGHKYLAEKNVPCMVNLRFENAKDFPVKGSRCAFSYLRIQDGSASPLALFGLPGYDSMEAGGSKTTEKTSEKEEKKETSKVEEEKKIAGGVGKVEGKKGKESKSPIKTSGSIERWQFGHVIRHQADNCDCNLRQVSMDIFKGYGDRPEDKRKMAFTEVSLVVDPSLNKVTTLVQPGDQPILVTKGCVETLFIKTTELKSIKKRLQDITDEKLVIFLSTDLTKLHDIDLIKEASSKKLCLGFFDDVELPSDIRNRLIEHNLTFYENLARPQSGFDMDKIDENEPYFAFKFAFSPLEEETSLGDSKKMEPGRKVNLADLVVFNKDVTEVADRCLKKDRLIELNQKWTQRTPILPNITRPNLGSDGKTLVFFDHFGTHIDAPYHVDEKNSMDTLRLPDSLDHPVCLKVDIPYEGKSSFSITKQHLLDWESKSGTKIPEKSMVILVTGFGDQNWAKPEEYQKGFVGLSLESAKFLVEERKVVAIGIDSLMIDDYATTQNMKFPAHWYLSSKNVVVIENLGGEGLSKLSNDGSAMCIMSYLRIEKSGGSPTAVFALLGKEPSEAKEGKSKGAVTTTTAKPVATGAMGTSQSNYWLSALIPLAIVLRERV